MATCVKCFQVEEVGVSYTLSSAAGSRGQRGELLITPPKR
jgi:hypothetical protein